MKKDGLIVRTTEDDRSMAKWANAQSSRAKVVMNLTNTDMCLLLAGHKLISNDDVFNILKQKGRLYSDKCVLNAGFTISKSRSVEQIQELFKVGEKESVYQEFIFHCERRAYFLKKCFQVAQHFGNILRLYDSNGKKDGLLSLAERELLESISNIQDLCDEGVKNVRTLVEEYHTYYTSLNDSLYNVGNAKKDEFSFRDSFVYYFSWLNWANHAPYRTNCHSIDDSIEDFFRAIIDSREQSNCISKILQGKKIPRDTKVLPLNQVEQNFIDAFAFLD